MQVAGVYVIRAFDAWFSGQYDTTVVHLKENFN